ncbi:MAG TPA: precorrin-6A reductase [Candidatus Ornithomonoglobus intestinigallinarum]|uniref:Precorrin-6A reductase n=1 Tax=Candidatus Ornithomonoglobus intestinigallinarum TaxID=2840894 RepID=A0A9D1H324_9FIRM|nr:precorrin-6A reductase [Candidatus Ornithomonoglobus intestinigallinarum]
MRTLLFGGTTEGREAAAILKESGADFILSVATEYGREVMKDSGINILCGRLGADEIASLIKKEGIKLVIDATHPYAEKASENIEAACLETSTEYLAITRESERIDGGLVVESAAEAAAAAAELDGKIFIATGSKEAEAFKILPPERLTVRVLPSEENIKKLESMGAVNIIAAKGPFSEAENIKMMSGCGILITKESGKNGGFGEKLSAAKKLGMKVIIIKRPRGKRGISIEEFEKNYDLHIGSRSGER